MRWWRRRRKEHVCWLAVAGHVQWGLRGVLCELDRGHGARGAREVVVAGARVVPVPPASRSLDDHWVRLKVAQKFGVARERCEGRVRARRQRRVQVAALRIGQERERARGSRPTARGCRRCPLLGHPDGGARRGSGGWKGARVVRPR